MNRKALQRRLTDTAQSELMRLGYVVEVKTDLGNGNEYLVAKHEDGQRVTVTLDCSHEPTEAGERVDQHVNAEILELIEDNLRRWCRRHIGPDKLVGLEELLRLTQLRAIVEAEKYLKALRSIVGSWQKKKDGTCSQ